MTPSFISRLCVLPAICVALYATCDAALAQGRTPPGSGNFLAVVLTWALTSGVVGFVIYKVAEAVRLSKPDPNYTSTSEDNSLPLGIAGGLIVAAILMFVFWDAFFLPFMLAVGDYMTMIFLGGILLFFVLGGLAMLWDKITGRF